MIWNEPGAGDRPRRLMLTATFVGTPDVDDASPEFVLPGVASGVDAGGGWRPIRLSLRVSVAGGEPEIGLESYTGAGAFDPDPVADVAVDDDEYEASVAVSGEALPAGAKVRLVCIAPGTAEGWTAVAEFEEAT